MDIKDKIECLKYLSQSHRSQFDERRKIEWRIIFAVLAFYVLPVAVIYKENISVTAVGFFGKLLIWILFLLLALITSIYLGFISMANNINKTFSENAEDAIDALLQDKPITTLPIFIHPRSNWTKWRGLFKKGLAMKWSWIWQVVTLFAFAIASVMFIIKKC